MEQAFCLLHFLFCALVDHRLGAPDPNRSVCNLAPAVTAADAVYRKTVAALESAQCTLGICPEDAVQRLCAVAQRVLSMSINTTELQKNRRALDCAAVGAQLFQYAAP